MELPLTNTILHDPVYAQTMETLRELEQDRIFCRHGMAHCLDVARITMLLCREHGVGAEPDMVYAAALLHDIGRAAEYTGGIPHEEASIPLARTILTECHAPAAVQEQILHLIACHRHARKEDGSLAYLFSLADKRSRCCFACPAYAECSWAEERRNLTITE